MKIKNEEKIHLERHNGYLENKLKWQFYFTKYFIIADIFSIGEYMDEILS